MKENPKKKIARKMLKKGEPKKFLGVFRTKAWETRKKIKALKQKNQGLALSQ
jgi:hypothetical protein